MSAPAIDWSDLNEPADRPNLTVVEEPTRRQDHDNDVERIVLGSLMLNPAVVDDVSAVLRPTDFHQPRHQIIYETILGLHVTVQPVEQFALAAHMADQGTLGRIGGGPYLHELTHVVPIAVQVMYYAHRVAKLAYRRGLAEFAAYAAQLAEQAIEPEVADDKLRARLDEMSGRRPTAGGVARWGTLLSPGMDAMEEATRSGGQMGIPTGLVDLDRLTTGWHPGELGIVAGRPGAGKTVALVDFCRAAAIKNDVPALLISLEMRELEIFYRMVAAECSLNLTAVRTGRLDDRDWTAVARFAGRTENVPLWIYYAPQIDFAGIRAVVKQAVKRHGIGLFAVDYIQKAPTPGTQPRHIELGNLSGGLKLLAQEYEITALAAAQLNRASEGRGNKRPQLSDLSESDRIAQDADKAVIIHRPDYYDKKDRPGEADFIVDKNRNGPTETVTVAAQLHHARFMSMEVQ